MVAGQSEQRGVVSTPPDIAAFMASLIPTRDAEACTILDPAAGAGVLASSAVRELIQRRAKEIRIHAYEIDPELARRATESLRALKTSIADGSTHLAFEVRETDFLGPGKMEHRAGSSPDPGFDVVILNPPYFKVRRQSRWEPRLPPSSPTHTNIYALFLAQAVRAASEPGCVIAITPRSWFSGAYFRRFRAEILAHTDLTRIHSFVRRDEAFREAGVLQETTVFVLQKRKRPLRPDVVVSISTGRSDLLKPLTFVVPWVLLNPQPLGGAIRIPETVGQLEALRNLDPERYRLSDFGLRVATGPVVGFRSIASLVEVPDPPNTVPLLWASHVTDEGLRWPGAPDPKHPPYILVTRDPRPRILADEEVVLVRRFSAKEDVRRVVACRIGKSELGGRFAVENHLNVIHGFHGPRGAKVAEMLCTYLNSERVDDWFRAVSGTTQINARDLRDLPITIPIGAPEPGSTRALSDWR